jgi:AcrR family transcriptional regulator
MIKPLPTSPRTPAGAGPERPAKGRLHLLAAAERLFATQGLGVPNRDIIAAAGQRNRSAINYHFTSRAGLIDAVREQHEIPIAQHRQHLIARLPEPEDRTTRQLIEAHVQPVATEMLRCVPSYWARLSEMLLADQPLRLTRGSTPATRPRQPGAAPLPSGLSELMVAHLTRLTSLPELEAADRVALTVRFLNNGLACWERDSQAGAGGITPLAPFTLALTDLAVAMLDAPSSVPSQPPSPVVPGQLRSAAVAPLIGSSKLAGNLSLADYRSLDVAGCGG